jgi:Lon protease-like protein
MSEEPFALPLFLLNTVLFPGAALPLHVFEQRYRLMIGHCMEKKAPFGVALIKEGQEVGEPATPFSVGTTARIGEVEKLEGGGMNIVVRGERRFRVLELVQLKPYVVGRVEEIKEAEGKCNEDFIRQVRRAFTDYARIVAGFRGGWVRDVDSPVEPTALSYFVAANLQIELPDKQRLLEVSTTGERLERELFILMEAQERLRKELERKSPFSGPRLN